MLLTAAVAAPPRQGWCQSVATVALAAATGRDGGVPRADMEAKARELPTPEARAAGATVIAGAYLFPKLTPKQYAGTVYRACMEDSP